MADCCICGANDGSLPENWIDWECPRCVDDTLWDTVGCHSPQEKLVTTKHHASASRHFSVSDIDLEDFCLEIAEELSVPRKHLDSAVLEGCLAYSENRDIPSAIQYWAESEDLI